MKNRVLGLVMIVMVVGSMLVGCGNSGVGTEVKNDSGVSTNTEVSDAMSDKVKEYFDKIRNGILEENKTREEFVKTNPAVTLPPLEESASADGLECLETFCFKFDSEEDYLVTMDVIRQLVYNQEYTKYYIEYVSETNEVVEFKFYVGK